MSWNGSGSFVRLYSWVADAAAGIDITASRMDNDTNDITGNGFGNTLTRDGQGSATASLPMNTFAHTNVGNAAARNQYAAAGQVQDGALNYVTSGGTANALTAAYAPAVTVLVDGMKLRVPAIGANTIAAPTFIPNGVGSPLAITKLGGQALALGDMFGAGHELELTYRMAGPTWELTNPATASGAVTPNQLLAIAQSYAYS